MTTIKTCSFLALVTLIAASATADEPKRPTTVEALQAEINALKPVKVAWREIAWKSCLLDGLKEARRDRKPLLLWIFIDRPTDDARC